MAGVAFTTRVSHCIANGVIIFKIKIRITYFFTFGSEKVWFAVTFAFRIHGIAYITQVSEPFALGRTPATVIGIQKWCGWHS